MRSSLSTRRALGVLPLVPLLTVTFLALVLALRGLPTLSVTAGESGFRRFLRGFTWEEQPASLPDAQIILHGAAGAPGTLTLVIERRSWTPERAADHVWLKRDGAVVAQALFQPRRHSLLFDLPAAATVGPWQESGLWTWSPRRTHS